MNGEPKGSKVTIVGTVQSRDGTDLELDLVHVAFPVTGGGALGVSLEARGVRHRPGDPFELEATVEESRERELVVDIVTSAGDVQRLTVDRRGLKRGGP